MNGWGIVIVMGVLMWIFLAAMLLVGLVPSA
jgi:hypothetical protein